MKEDKPFWQKAKPVERVYIKYDQKNNLPTQEAILYNQREKEVKALTSAICVTNETSHNITNPQKELLRLNFRLGHTGFQHVQWLICTGRLEVQGNSKSVANCKRKKYAFCEFGKGHCLTDKLKTAKNNPMKYQVLKKDHILPGKMVSEDQYIPRSLGRLYHTKGKSDQSDMLSGGCVSIDHASGCMRIKHQLTINYTENVKEK